MLFRPVQHMIFSTLDICLSLRTMSYITSYPSSLKQLDLSHNKICVWPSLPQVHDDFLDSTEQAFISCYHQETGFKMSVNKLLSGTDIINV